MSAGKFSKVKYETDSGEIVVVKAQPESLALTLTPGGANVAATGTPTSSGVYALSLGNRRRKPFSGRYVALRFTGTLPAGYQAGAVLRVPIFTLAVYNAITDDGTGTYLGQPVEVVYKTRQTGG